MADDRDKINRKHMVPRIPGLPEAERHKAMRRSHFLGDDPKLHTFFGPGQRPDAVEDGHYEAPDDWPKAGMLLRVPQIVWLTCNTYDPRGDETYLEQKTYLQLLLYDNFLGSYNSGGSFYTGATYIDGFGEEKAAVRGWSLVAYSTTDFQSAWRYSETPSDGDTSGPTTEEFEDLIPGFDPTAYLEPAHLHIGNPPDDWYHETIPNPYRTGRDHFYDDVFPEVKLRIEKVRGGRTWVQAIDWQDLDTDLWQSVDEPTPFYTPLVLPIEAAEPYFGTNFLHIHIGVPYRADFLPSLFGNDLFDVDGDEDLPAMLERLARCLKKFAGIKIKLYGFAPTWEEYPLLPDYPFSTTLPSGWPPLKQEVPGDPPNNYNLAEPLHYNITGSNYTFQQVDPPYGSFWDIGDDGANLDIIHQQLIDHHDAQQADLTGFVQHQRDGDADLETILQALAAKAEDAVPAVYSTSSPVVEYIGNGVDLTADDLVNAIAAHFGFDPGTGDPLG